MAHEDEQPKMGMYFTVFIFIAVMTLANVGISFMDASGTTRLMMNLIIASVQVALLSLYFMHLRKSDKVTKLVGAASLFWLFILFVLLLTDYLTRQYGVY